MVEGVRGLRDVPVVVVFDAGDGVGDVVEELGGCFDDMTVVVAAEVAFFEDFEGVGSEFEVILDVEVRFNFSGEAAAAAVEAVGFVEAGVVGFEGVFDAVLDVFDVDDGSGVGEVLDNLVGESLCCGIVVESKGGHGLADGSGDLVLVEGDELTGAFPHLSRHRFRNNLSL